MKLNPNNDAMNSWQVFHSEVPQIMEPWEFWGMVNVRGDEETHYHQQENQDVAEGSDECGGSEPDVGGDAADDQGQNDDEDQGAIVYPFKHVLCVTGEEADGL